MSPIELTGVLFAVAIAAGLIGSLIGLGGGIVIVPVLTLGFHIGIREAIGASIVAVVASSVAAAPRSLNSGFSNLRLGVFLAVATTLGALTGAFVSGLVDARALFGIFGVVLAFSGAQMIAKHRTGYPVPAGEASAVSAALGLDGHYHDPVAGERVDYTVQRPMLGLSLMYLAGTVSGMLGIGSGALKVPAMDVAMRLPLKVSTATSNLLIGVTASAGAVVYLVKGDVDPYLAGPVAIGVLLGAWLGGRVFARLAPSVVRWTFLAVLAIVTTQMLGRAIGA